MGKSLGLTVQDIDDHMKSSWGNRVEKTIEFDNILKEGKSNYVHDTQVTILANGFVAIHRVQKHALKNATNTISQILTLSEDITSRVDSLALFEIYQNLFKNNIKAGILKFLLHYDIFKHFFELPTKTEVKILLLKKRLFAIKIIAQHLSLSPKTVACHLDNLKTKLSCDLSQIEIKDTLDFSNIILNSP